jgi:hypothetical protein
MYTSNELCSIHEKKSDFVWMIEEEVLIDT